MIVNKAIASVNAKPKIAQLNNNLAMLGFLDTESNKFPKIIPIPTPTPDSAIVAKPAPICLNSVTI